MAEQIASAWAWCTAPAQCNFGVAPSALVCLREFANEAKYAILKVPKLMLCYPVLLKIILECVILALARWLVGWSVAPTRKCCRFHS